MTFTYSAATDAGKVRLLITDVDDQHPIFQDDEIEAFLELNDSNIKRAAASALDTIASKQALVLKVIRLLDLSTDGASTARALREHADRLRIEAENDDAGDGGLFDYAEMNLNAFTARERVIKQAQRDE